jgi:hypothetical protein
MQLEDLKLLIASKLDVAEFLDILGFEMFDLVEALEDEIIENKIELMKACDWQIANAKTPYRKHVTLSITVSGIRNGYRKNERLGRFFVNWTSTTGKTQRLMMNQYSKLLAGLKAVKSDLNEELDELLAFAEVMARKHNTLELDEDGFFYCTAAGPIEEVIPVMEKQLGKLERIKKQRDSGAWEA